MKKKMILRRLLLLSLFTPLLFINSAFASLSQQIFVFVSLSGSTLVITTTTLPGGTVSTVYSQSVLAEGGITPYTWNISAGSLPDGLSVNASTGAITGIPTTTGTSNFTVQATDSQDPAATVNKALSIFINSQPGFSNLGFYDELGTLIPADNIFVDTPIKAKGNYTAGSDGSSQAMSQWVINDRTLVDTLFVDTTVSGDLTSCWLPGKILEPEKAYTLKSRAQNSNGSWSGWVTLDFDTVLQSQTADANNDGVPDDQTPTDTNLRYYGFIPYDPDIPDSGLPNTALIVKFNNEPILVESTGSDTISYFAGITPSEAPPSGSNPYGVFTVRVEVSVGATITIVYSFPDVLPSGAKWYKYDESAPAGSKWIEYTDAIVSGNIVTVELQDGGKGDADGIANGIIIDPAGPVTPSSGDGGGGGGGGALPVGPLAAGISAFLVWWKRRKQRRG